MGRSRIPTVLVMNQGNSAFTILSDIERLFLHMHQCHGAAINRRMRWIFGPGSSERGYCAGSKKISGGSGILQREYSGKYVHNDVNCFLRDMDLQSAMMRGDWIVVSGCPPGSPLLKVLANELQKIEKSMRWQDASKTDTGSSVSKTAGRSSLQPGKDAAGVAGPTRVSIASQFCLWVVLEDEPLFCQVQNLIHQFFLSR